MRDLVGRVLGIFQAPRLRSVGTACRRSLLVVGWGVVWDRGVVGGWGMVWSIVGRRGAVGCGRAIRGWGAIWSWRGSIRWGGWSVSVLGGRTRAISWGWAVSINRRLKIIWYI